MTERRRHQAAHADPPHEPEEHRGPGTPPETGPEPQDREAPADRGGDGGDGGEAPEDRGAPDGRQARGDREAPEDREARGWRDRRSRDAGATREDNPFAPPPEGTPDRPWQPRRPGAEQDDTTGTGGTGDGRGEDGDDRGDAPEQGRPSRWGSQWSPRQPGRQSGGFGGPPTGPDRGNGEGNGFGRGGRRGLRWDPTDPLQRHARYALHAGIWGLFFALFGIMELALLLGALSLYWGINALRGKPRQGTGGAGGSGNRGDAGATAEDVAGTDRASAPDTGRTGRGGPPVPVAVTPAQAAKAKTSAAISGLVAAGLTLAIVAGTFTLQMVYQEYYTCRQDALTTASREECKDLLPENLRPFLENQG
ncbi:hypothetical protein [Streptomyces sp. JJ36]|uniref:hypothetical protein n=1 Tax=Streptomyces sp. JJ36 TaxID=2736645 RepID=UPI001F43F95A|nr:hypothetical protein [Streptomyces sp. JJ36]